MDNQELNFVEKYVRGKVKADAILDHIDSWHHSGYKVELHEFLGLSLTEHMIFVDSDSALNPILETKRKAHLRSQMRLIVNE